MKPYFFQDGISDLAKTLNGKENIYLGIRPYGFHAGNLTTLVIYPILLCQKLKKNNIEPNFNFYVFINDWEQDGLDGPDPKKYPYNIFPKKTTFQYTPDPDNCHKNIVDHWEPIIKKDEWRIKSLYPSVKIHTVRNSSLKLNEIFKRELLNTIKYPDEIIEILRKYSQKSTLDIPISFAKAICPKCFSARGETLVLGGDLIQLKCDNCQSLFTQKYEFFDYWFYHKSLALPRIEIFKIDLCITGLEHYNEGDYAIREALIKRFSPTISNPLTLYSPLILGKDNQPMGKSKGNYKYIDFDVLYPIVSKSKNKEKIKIEE